MEKVCVPILSVARWIRDFKVGRQDLKGAPHPGLSKEVVNKDTISLVRCTIEDEPNICFDQMISETGLSRGTPFRIVHDELHLRKICSRWVPHKLTDAQQKQRVDNAKELLVMFGPKRLGDIVTGDECWIWFYTTATKEHNAVWIGEDGDRPTVLKQGFRSRRRMFSIFFNSQGPLVVDILPEGGG